MPMKLNRETYEKLVQEDIEWLRKQPECLERSHILQILEHAVAYEYGPGTPEACPRCKKPGMKGQPHRCYA